MEQLTMEFLELIKNRFIIVGISSDKRNQAVAFNGTNMKFLFAMCMRFGSQILYLLIEADSFEEYVNLCFPVSGQIMAMLFFIYAILETPKIYAFLNNFGNTIEKSNYLQTL